MSGYNESTAPSHAWTHGPRGRHSHCEGAQTQHQSHTHTLTTTTTHSPDQTSTEMNTYVSVVHFFPVVEHRRRSATAFRIAGHVALRLSALSVRSVRIDVRAPSGPRLSCAVKVCGRYFVVTPVRPVVGPRNANTTLLAASGRCVDRWRRWQCVCRNGVCSESA